MASFLRQIPVLSWFVAKPLPLPVHASNVTFFYETGPNLIDAIYAAIVRGQHVALSGPRGCGKSYCISQAVEKAKSAGIVPDNAVIKIQGNKEIPRDYLIEDEITLAVRNIDGQSRVVPETKFAPLFRTAARDGDGKPITNADGFVRCLDTLGQSFNSGDGGKKMVLFLDEINRFSDGVLDSLLLLLEEGEAVMQGQTYRLPIVVCMTMNPPGYDASARTLSPPLSARIGQQFRLLNPSLDVLSDQILQQVLPGLAVRIPDPGILRRAATVTLACWGDPRTGNPGFEYLSTETKDLLISLGKASRPLLQAQQRLSELCHYGPDGRALGDWTVAAAAEAQRDAQELGGVPRLDTTHYIDTAIRTIAHKMHDKFSAATRPDLTLAKEGSIQAICRIILEEMDLTGVDPGFPKVTRKIDDAGELRTMARLISPDLEVSQLQSRLKGAGLTRDHEISGFEALISQLGGSYPKNEEADMAEVVSGNILKHTRFLETRENGVLVFGHIGYQRLISWLSEELTGDPHIKSALAEIAAYPCLSEPLEQYLQKLTCVIDGAMRAEEFMAAISRHNIKVHRRELVRKLAALVDHIWCFGESFDPDPLDRIRQAVAVEPLAGEISRSVHCVLADFAEAFCNLPSRGMQTRHLAQRLRREESSSK